MKNYNEYDNKTNNICLETNNGSYTYWDILGMAENDEELARNLFDLSEDHRSPETVLEDIYLMDDEDEEE